MFSAALGYVVEPAAPSVLANAGAATREKIKGSKIGFIIGSVLSAILCYGESLNTLFITGTGIEKGHVLIKYGRIVAITEDLSMKLIRIKYLEYIPGSRNRLKLQVGQRAL